MFKLFATTTLLIVLAALPAVAGDFLLENFNGDPTPRITVGQSVEGSVVYKLDGTAKDGFLSLEFTRGKMAGMAYVYLPIAERLARRAADYDGITFKVKGDGTSTYGLIEVRADNFVSIYQAIFPLTSKDWTTVSIRWDDFFQMNDAGRDTPINWRDLNKFAFGSRADWGSCRYCVDDIALATIPARPPYCAPDGYAKLESTVRKLKEGEPLTIVVLGDSITHGTKVPKEKRETDLYFQVAAAHLKTVFPASIITTVNAGTSGDTITEGIIRVGHEVAPQRPDLVIVLLGANDAIYDFPKSRVEKAMSKLIDALIISTDAEILILGPTPISDKPGVPEGYDELYAKIAADKRVAYLNLTPALTILARDDYQRAFGDNVHLSEYGHRIVAKAVSEYILELAK